MHPNDCSALAQRIEQVLTETDKLRQNWNNKTREQWKKTFWLEGLKIFSKDNKDLLYTFMFQIYE